MKKIVLSLVLISQALTIGYANAIQFDNFKTLDITLSQFLNVFDKEQERESKNEKREEISVTRYSYFYDYGYTDNASYTLTASVYKQFEVNQIILVGYPNAGRNLSLSMDRIYSAILSACMAAIYPEGGLKNRLDLENSLNLLNLLDGEKRSIERKGKHITLVFEETTGIVLTIS